MCMSCFKDYGSPKIVTQATISAAALIDEVYAHHPAGGNAHIVIDDWNLDDEQVQWCLDNMDANHAGDVAAERRCLEALLLMTEEERASALAISFGWVAPNAKHEAPL